MSDIFEQMVAQHTITCSNFSCLEESHKGARLVRFRVVCTKSRGIGF